MAGEGYPATKSLSASTILARLIGATTLAAGSLLYGSGGATLTALPIGSAAQILSVTAGIPSWIPNAGAALPASYAIGDILYASSSSALARLADVATGNALISGGVTTAPAWGKIGLTTHVSGVLPSANGGTDQSSYAIGDLLYASGATALSKLADVATGNALISGGVTTAPAWGKIGLTTHVSGILPSANGGTGVNNAGTLTNASSTTITGGGTLALGGFTLTVPAAGTAGLLGTAQTWSAANIFSAITTVSNTTATTASTNGSLVVGNGTAATTVGIGAGVVMAGAGFGFGEAPSASANAFTALASVNGGLYYRVKNSSALTSAQADFRAFNDGDQYIQFGIAGSGKTTYGALIANRSFLYSINAVGLVLMTDNASAPIVFASGGNSEKVRVSATGNLLVGTAADTGLTGAGGLSVASATSTSSAITGAVVIGNGVAATSVGIGGGSIQAGGAITAAGNITANGGTATVKSTSSSAGFVIDAFTGNSGAIVFYINAVAKAQIQSNGTNAFIFADITNAYTALNYAAGSAAAAVWTFGGTLDATSPTAASVVYNGGIGFGVTKSLFGGGIKSTSPTLGIGYATGAGGTVSQATSRATGVTLSKVCGQITLFTAAGSATPATFVVTNTTVAATDTIVINDVSGSTNVYFWKATAAAGSFTVTFWTTGGTASDTPIISFTVIKAVNA